MWKWQNLWGQKYKQIIVWFVRDIWHKYHSRYFKIASNFIRLTAREITYNNFEISPVVFTPNITTNHAITYTNTLSVLDLNSHFPWLPGRRLFESVIYAGPIF